VEKHHQSAWGGRGMSDQSELEQRIHRKIVEEAPEHPLMAPVHLAGCEHIASCFMVRRSTVREWKRAGAPIARIGNRLTAEYNQLMMWLVRHS
jgi:hypothetical protein